MLYSTILSHPNEPEIKARSVPSIQREDYAANHNGLGGHRWISADQSTDRNLLPAARQRKYCGIFYLWPRRFLVAGWNQHGCHHVCRGYAASCYRSCGDARDRRQLVVVEPVSDRDADGIFLRAILAARGNHDRR